MPQKRRKQKVKSSPTEASAPSVGTTRSADHQEERREAGRASPADQSQPALDEDSVVRLLQQQNPSETAGGREQNHRSLTLVGCVSPSRNTDSRLKLLAEKRKTSPYFSGRDDGFRRAFLKLAKWAEPAVAILAARHSRIIENGQWRELVAEATPTLLDSGDSSGNPPVTQVATPLIMQNFKA